MNPRLAALALTLAIARPAAAEDPLRLTCDPVVADLPFNAGGWDGDELEWPSMPESLTLSKCLYQLGHKGIQRGLREVAERPLWGQLGVVAFDLLMPGRPGGTAWSHEEWHRAVLSVRDIDSYNQIYDLRFFGGGIVAVTDVRDADLAALKRDHNPDLVRLAAAGIESYHELDLALEKDEFFRDTTVYNRFLLWLNAVNGVAYVGSSLLDSVDNIEREGHETEDSEDDKDILGHDVTSWVYDLHRPDEPYADRGAHPNGAGVDRYISRGDLSDAEKRYLKIQAGLALLNFVDPFLFGKTAFTTGDVRWNATLRHHLTSFGAAIDGNLFLEAPRLGRAFFTLHSYYNKERPYVGLEAQVIDRPVGPLRLTARAMLWEQPRDQAFRTTAGTFGGLVGARAAVSVTGWFRPTVEVEAKSAGWVAGNPYLDAVVGARVGFEATF